VAKAIAIATQKLIPNTAIITATASSKSFLSAERQYFIFHLSQLWIHHQDKPNENRNIGNAHTLQIKDLQLLEK